MTLTQTIALVLIILVLAVWLFIIINNKTEKSKPRDGCRYFWLGYKDSDNHIEICRGTIDKVRGFVSDNRPINGDVIRVEDTEGTIHCYLMTNVKWDDTDGTAFTATITTMEEE